jgi:hypothetical protein
MNEQDKPLRRSNVLKRLTNLYEKPRYLEVGVARGTTFNRVPAERKVAVDPLFRFDHEAMGREHPEATYHQVPSDEYFNTIIEPDEEFDVIYLDGLHVYDQTLRDLLNALEHLQPQGVIVIDDTRPPTYLASLADREQFFQLKRATRSLEKQWMGDVYKTVYFIEALCPHLSYATIANNHGQTVVWRTRRDETPRFTVKEIADLTFERFQQTQEEVLRLQRFGEIRRRVRRDLEL